MLTRFETEMEIRRTRALEEIAYALQDIKKIFVAISLNNTTTTKQQKKAKKND